VFAYLTGSHLWRFCCLQWNHVIRGEEVQVGLERCLVYEYLRELAATKKILSVEYCTESFNSKVFKIEGI